MYRTVGWAALAACVLAACGGKSNVVGPATQPNTSLKSCGTAKALFTTPPIALAELSGWVPLGSLNPTGHLFPVDHQYLYHTNPDRPGGPNYRVVDVVSPGDIVISNASRTVYPAGNTDYALTFSPCSDVRAVLGHVQTLTQTLLSQMGAFNQFCDTYAPAGTATITTCFTKQLNISIAAGTPVGTAGGVPFVFGLDFQMHDKRIKSLVFANPARWIVNSDSFDSYHVVAASDYFAEPAFSQIKQKLGQFDGSMLRTAAPIGGTIEVDVPGSAQGYWFNPTRSPHPEEPHLALAPDNVDPSIMAVSMGLSQPGFQSGLYRFTPTTSGKVNRNPAQITADGEIYCYEFGFQSVLLLRLMDQTTLRAEGRRNIPSCASQLPYTFNSSSTFDYKR